MDTSAQAPAQPAAPTNTPITPGNPPQTASVGKETSGKAIAALVLGILGFGIVAIILGALALGDCKRKGLSGKGMAIAGIVLGALGLLLSFLIVLGAIAYFGVLSPSKMLPERTSFNAPIMNTEMAVVSSDGSIMVPLLNGLGETVSITGAADAPGSYDPYCVGASIRSVRVDGVESSLPVSVANGQSFILTFLCQPLERGALINVDIGFTYSTASGVERSHFGEVMARVP